MRQNLIKGNGIATWHHALLRLFPDGLAKGQVVEVQNDTTSDRWYARIVDGKVKGEHQDPFVSGQWLKANSTTVLESTKNERVYIKSIIAIVDV